MLCSTSTKTSTQDSSRITSTSRAVNRLAWTSMSKDVLNSQNSTKMVRVTLPGETQLEVAVLAETMEEATQAVAAADTAVVKEATIRVVAITIKVMAETKEATRTTTEGVVWAEEAVVEVAEATTKVDTSATTTETQMEEENLVVVLETGVVSRANKTTVTLLLKTTRTTTMIDLKQLPLNVEEAQEEEVETSQEVAVAEIRAVALNAEVRQTTTPTRTRPTKTTAALQAMVLDSVEEEVVLLQLEDPKTPSTNKRMATRTNITTRLVAMEVLSMSAT